MTHNGTSKVRALAWVLRLGIKNKNRKQAYDECFLAGALRTLKFS